MMSAPHPLNRLIVDAFNNVLDREAEQQAEVRGEIQRNGTYWAAREIWKLRRQVAAMRKNGRSVMGQYTDLTAPPNVPPVWPFIVAALALGAVVSFGILFFT